MRVSYFNRDHGQQPDSGDASSVLGLPPGTVNFGDIRKACEGHTDDAIIRSKNDRSGFEVTDFHGKGYRGL
jgi:hypothetical protein